MAPPDLKPVLVIDNREMYPPVGRHGDLVLTMKSAKPGELEPSDYAAVFVHDANKDELNWARGEAAEHFNGLYFKFTGRRGQFDNVTFHRGAYKLPRWVLNERFAGFLARYRQRGIVDRETARIFEEL